MCEINIIHNHIVDFGLIAKCLNQKPKLKYSITCGSLLLQKLVIKTVTLLSHNIALLNYHAKALIAK